MNANLRYTIIRADSQRKPLNVAAIVNNAEFDAECVEGIRLANQYGVQLVGFVPYWLGRDCLQANVVLNVTRRGE